MAPTALLIYLTWLILTFGVRTWLQWRRTGDTGFRGANLPRGSAQWWARLMFGAALLAGAAGPVAELSGLAAADALDTPAVRGTGLALALLVAASWAVVLLAAPWRRSAPPGWPSRTATATRMRTGPVPKAMVSSPWTRTTRTPCGITSTAWDCRPRLRRAPAWRAAR